MGNSASVKLLSSCLDGNASEAKRILATEKIFVNEPAGGTGWTPLFAAACNGHANVVKVLKETLYSAFSLSSSDTLYCPQKENKSELNSKVL
jgi:hypothetical protein